MPTGRVNWHAAQLFLREVGRGSHRFRVDDWRVASDGDGFLHGRHAQRQRQLHALADGDHHAVAHQRSKTLKCRGEFV